MHCSGYRLGMSSGRCINKQRGRVQIQFFFILFFFFIIYLFILSSGEGLVPFVHPIPHSRIFQRLKMAAPTDCEA